MFYKRVFKEINIRLEIEQALILEEYALEQNRPKSEVYREILLEWAMQHCPEKVNRYYKQDKEENVRAYQSMGQRPSFSKPMTDLEAADFADPANPVGRKPVEANKGKNKFSNTDADLTWGREIREITQEDVDRMNEAAKDLEVKDGVKDGSGEN